MVVFVLVVVEVDAEPMVPIVPMDPPVPVVSVDIIAVPLVPMADVSVLIVPLMAVPEESVDDIVELVDDESVTAAPVSVLFVFVSFLQA